MIDSLFELAVDQFNHLIPALRDLGMTFDFDVYGFLDKMLVLIQSLIEKFS